MSMTPTIADPNFAVPTCPGTVYHGAQDCGGSPWTFTASSGGECGVTGPNTAWAGSTIPDGGQGVYLHGLAAVSQAVDFGAGGQFTLGLAVAQRVNWPNNQTVAVQIDGATVGSYAPPNDNDFHPYTTPAFTVAGGTHTLALVGTDPAGNDCAVVVTGLALAPVSAPPATPTVTGVTVTPATTTGTAAQPYAATVAGTNSPAQTVTWTASAGAITAAGLFTPPATTTAAQSITITATSTVDTTKSGTATYTVPATVPPSAPIGTLGTSPDPGDERISYAAITAGTNPVAGVYLYAGSAAGMEGANPVAMNAGGAAGSFDQPIAGNVYTLRAADTASPPNFSAASAEIAGGPAPAGSGLTIGQVQQVVANQLAAFLGMLTPLLPTAAHLGVLDALATGMAGAVNNTEAGIATAWTNFFN